MLVARALLVALVIAVATTVGVVWDEHTREIVSFRGRDYIQPRVVSVVGMPIADAHARVRGMEAFVPARVPGTPGFLALRRGDGRFVLYGLSGGP